MEENVIIKTEGDERFPEVIHKLGLFEKVVRISYLWGEKDTTYITGRIVEVTSQFIFIERQENPKKVTKIGIALRKIIGFREVV